MLYLLNKTHSYYNKYFCSIMEMPMILIKEICAIIGGRVCYNILLGVNTAKAECIQVAVNQNEM
jgi:hypothetical protein